MSLTDCRSSHSSCYPSPMRGCLTLTSVGQCLLALLPRDAYAVPTFTERPEPKGLIMLTLCPTPFGRRTGRLARAVMRNRAGHAARGINAATDP